MCDSAPHRDSKSLRVQKQTWSMSLKVATLIFLVNLQESSCDMPRKWFIFRRRMLVATINPKFKMVQGQMVRLLHSLHASVHCVQSYPGARTVHVVGSCFLLRKHAHSFLVAVKQMVDRVILAALVASYTPILVLEHTHLTCMMWNTSISRVNKALSRYTPTCQASGCHAPLSQLRFHLHHTN